MLTGTKIGIREIPDDPDNRSLNIAARGHFFICCCTADDWAWGVYNIYIYIWFLLVVQSHMFIFTYVRTYYSTIILLVRLYFDERSWGWWRFEKGLLSGVEGGNVVYHASAQAS